MAKKKISSKKSLTNLDDASRAMAKAKEILGREGTIIKTVKTDNGWELEIEVIEVSEHMKKIGIPKPIYDKNIYQVILDQHYNLVSYERKGQRPLVGE